MTEQEPTTRIRARVNRIEVDRTVPARMMLSHFLRSELALPGTKVSCELQVCGACSVLVAGRPVSSCTFLAADIDGVEVETVEGLADDDGLHPLQESFVDNFALQCGFCTAGFLMMSKALLEREPDPSEEQVKEWLDGNLCRCTGYEPIVAAVLDAAGRMKDAKHVR